MADNRQFTDHNSVGGVNVYYKDRQLKERSAVAGASAIANLKFLLVNGDDDGFNTAIKAYIDEAVRSAFGALVDNLDKGTAISRVLATDANHDLGSITPANLASVLGVPNYRYEHHFEQQGGDYTFSLPPEATFYGIIFVKEFSTQGWSGLYAFADQDIKQIVSTSNAATSYNFSLSNIGTRQYKWHSDTTGRFLIVAFCM